MRIRPRHEAPVPKGAYVLLFPALLAAVLSACGLKADPLPSLRETPGLVQDLALSNLSDGLLLQWRPPVGEVVKIRIFRSETAPDVCPTCPMEYRLLTELRWDPERATMNGPARYTDRDVRPGMRYAYRLTACNEADRCSEKSEVVQTVFGVRP